MRTAEPTSEVFVSDIQNDTTAAGPAAIHVHGQCMSYRGDRQHRGWRVLCPLHRNSIDIRSSLPPYLSQSRPLVLSNKMMWFKKVMPEHPNAGQTEE